MSIAHNKKRKSLRRSKSAEHRAILSDLHRGKFPKGYFVKQTDGDNKLERKHTLVGSKHGPKTRIKNKLTWRIVSTLKLLLGLSSASK
jgi:hypothetical protein